MFNGDGLGGVDLDGCRNPDTGTVADWANALVEDFNSYAEVSPSGTGIKIFATGAPAALTKTWSMEGEPINGKSPQIEAYVNKRYFAVTGAKLSQTPDEIRAAPEAWARLRQRPVSKRVEGSDKAAAAGRNGALFALGSRVTPRLRRTRELRRGCAA